MSRRRTAPTRLFALALLAGAPSVGGCDCEGPGGECEGADDCDDGILCTIESCQGGECVHDDTTCGSGGSGGATVLERCEGGTCDNDASCPADVPPFMQDCANPDVCCHYCADPTNLMTVQRFCCLNGKWQTDAIDCTMSAQLDGEASGRVVACR